MTRRWTTQDAPTIPATPTASLAARCATAAFGLVPVQGHSSLCADNICETADRFAREVLSNHQTRTVLLTGPSGSGKTVALGAIRRAAHRADRSVYDAGQPLPRSDLSVFDSVARASDQPGRPFGSDRVQSALSSAGLAEPALWVRSCGVLSVGEQARLRLARAMIASCAGDVVLCDEFGSNLDRISAESLARTATRWANRTGVLFVTATAHEDMPGFLSPDIVMHADSGNVERPVYDVDTDEAKRTIRYEGGDIADFKALARHHYLGGKPATIAAVMRAIRTTGSGDHLAGVLVVSHPNFNAIWRRQAWPGRYDGVSKALAAERLNREVRTISRVIVEPRSRGLGVASGLVRAYLAAPLTPATEAIAAMGGVSPFFKAAGMTEYELPRSPHDARLLDAIDFARMRAVDLLDERFHADPFIERELTRWAKHAWIRIEHQRPLPAIARHAVCRLASSSRAYAAGGHDGSEQESG